MNFIICDDDKKFVERCREIIFKMMSKSKVKYDITLVESWKELIELSNNQGNRIYICGNVVNKKSLDFAREIRNSGDWNSPIIIVTNKKEFKNICYDSPLLMLDFIFKDDNIEKNLMNALNIAFKINSCCSCLCIAKDSEVYQISYDDICYIEKRLNENYSTIVTENGEYLIKKSIVSIYKSLEDYNFYKTHRSCIVNINKIKMVDFDKNIIKFKNKQTDLISRSNKKGLRERLESH